MIQHLEVFETLIGRMRWIIGILEKSGVFTPIESSSPSDEVFYDRVFSCESAKRSGCSISVDLFDNLLPAGMKKVDHSRDRSFVSLNINFPYEDGSDDNGAWLQLRYHVDERQEPSAKLNRDGYHPDREQEEAFAAFPNGPKTEAEVIAFIEAAAKYYLSRPIK